MNIPLTLSLGLLCVHSFFSTTQSFASSQSSTTRTTSLTNAAEIMILMSGNNWLTARDKVMAAQDGTLVKIYEWMLYREDYDTLPFERIASFIENNSHWPNQSALRRSAERNMPADLPAAAIIRWFEKHPPLTGRGIILLLNAARQNNQTDHAIQIIFTSWPDAEISNDDTKTLLQAIGQKLPQTANIQRLDKLLFAQKYTAARALSLWMGKGYPQLTEARIALAEDKPDVSRLIGAIPKHLTNNTGFLFERLSWRRRHDEDQGALEILKMATKLDAVPNPQEWWKERHIMIRRMIEKHDFKTAYILAANHGHLDKSSVAESEWLAGWLALRFLNQPQIALTHFNTMTDNVGTAISKSRGNYWSGRAEDQMGKPDQARKWYTLAATYPHTYYGQLAAQKLPDTSSNLQTIPPSPLDLQKIEHSDLAQAVIIANLARMNTEHNQLLSALIDTLDTSGEFMAAASKLDRSGDKTGSFRVAKAASWKNFFLGEYAYPSLKSQMNQIKGDHALYQSIIRQESQFDQQARSPAGALGLMQLMPPTAKETAHKLGIPHQTGWLTSKPDHNILLGSTYINGLTQRFPNALPMAIAGYNAGPGRVNQWIEQFGDPRLGKLDWIDWIELIPVGETRNYVQRVMENYTIYSNKHNGM
ncbi:MAG TPA: lytic transglycosylase domain-containing protein [Alphaproteobacteria bacterium]|jgi:soluble lytic murein transglycosylase|nr:lytic transglycosylase domain-containing protein [Alphaproteobacteria bacterium]HRK98209.1 lytic transglycosylase domain-containing protein [Alphaproteobacteria bacterium]